MLFKAFVVCLAIAAASAQSVTFRACAGGLTTPDFVESAMCPNNICQLNRGQVFSARAGVTTQAAHPILTVGIAASVFG